MFKMSASTVAVLSVGLEATVADWTSHVLASPLQRFFNPDGPPAAVAVAHLAFVDRLAHAALLSRRTAVRRPLFETVHYRVSDDVVDKPEMSYIDCMKTLTINADGRITFTKAMLRYLGVKPGDKVEVEPQPDGTVRITSAMSKRETSVQGASAGR